MTRCVCLFALAALAAGPLAGCGGGGSSTTSAGSTGISTPATSASASREAVAYVLSTPITKTSYEHWLAVEDALGAGSKAASHRVLGFLITSDWVLGEAANRHISASNAEVQKRYEELIHREFPKAGGLQKFLAKAKESTTDLLQRVRLELLESKIAATATAGRATAAAKKAALSSFQASFAKLWKARTKCLPAYLMEDCDGYKGAPEASSTSSSGGTAARGSSSAASRSNATGEVYNPPGGMSLSSPEFERNGAIPVQYTCDGAGISPKLQWQSVPAHTAELFLFVIDDGSNGPEGGIRWVVGGIEPSTHGVAAGQVPAGGIVGRNTAGKVGYSAICPAKGQTHTVEFVLYALKKKIALSPGFTPAVAESEYGGSIGASSVEYGVYHRK